MNITLFNKPYWIRRFGAQREVKGYLYSGYEDISVDLNVHPLSTDTIQALPEGERKIKRLEAQSSVPIIASSQKDEVKGDLLLYDGDWYECVSSQKWNHTILSHWNCQFVLVPADANRSPDLDNKPTALPGHNNDAGGN